MVTVKQGTRRRHHGSMWVPPMAGAEWQLSFEPDLTVAARVLPSIVNIASRKSCVPMIRRRVLFGSFFRRFFGDSSNGSSLVNSAKGVSGRCIVSPTVCSHQ